MEKTIHEKLVEVQKELKAPKGQTNNFGKYKYRSCEDIIEAVKPLLHERGLALILTDEIVNIGDRYYVEAKAFIVSGLDNENSGYGSTAFAREPENKKGMDESQITGAASSYARKYALNGLFAIDDTKDADTDEHRKQISPDPVDMEKVNKAITFFKKVIDKDQIEQGAPLIQDKWELLTNDERLKVQEGLKEKAPDCNKMYSTLLKEYQEFVPSVPE